MYNPSHFLVVLKVLTLTFHGYNFLLSSYHNVYSLHSKFVVTPLLPTSPPRHYSWTLVVFTQSNLVSVLGYHVLHILGDIAVVVFVWHWLVPLATYCLLTASLYLSIASSDKGRGEGGWSPGLSYLTRI